MIKAIALYNYLKSFTEDELKQKDIVIEIGREVGDIGISEYLADVENYPSQIRLVAYKVR